MAVFRRTFDAHLDQLSSARTWLNEVLPEFLTYYELSDKGGALQHRMTLCLSEIMANTIDYSSPPANALNVILEYKDRAIILSVEDDGSPFGGFEIAVNAAKRAHDVPTLDERGRGLYLVGNMCRDLHYTTKNSHGSQGVNRLMMVYDVAA